MPCLAVCTTVAKNPQTDSNLEVSTPLQENRFDRMYRCSKQ